jgi:O-antigen ligase
MLQNTEANKTRFACDGKKEKLKACSWFLAGCEEKYAAEKGGAYFCAGMTPAPLRLAGFTVRVFNQTNGMVKRSETKEKGLEIIPAYFLLFFIVLFANFTSLSIFINDFPFLRYLRQPVTLLSVLAVLHFFPYRGPKPGFRIPFNLFLFFSFYLFFNCLTSIDMANSVAYGLWLVAVFVFLYQLLVLRNGLSFRQMLYQFSSAAALVGMVFISVSFVGAYVLGIERFFDERYNYSQMRMTTEFSGVFGSNNSIGILTWLTSVLLLLLFELSGRRTSRLIFMAGSAALTLLLFFIGNRASMACGVVLWVIYFLWVYRSLLGLLTLSAGFAAGILLYQDLVIEKLRLEQFEGGNVLGNRSALLGEALAVAGEMDFFGVGYHNQRLSRKHFGLVSAGDKEYNFHNTYLAVVTELGYPGLIWIPGVVMLALFRLPVYRKPPGEARLLRMLKSILLVMLVFYLPVEDSVNSPGSPTFLIFWIFFFLLITGLGEKPQDEEAVQAKG